MLGTTMESGSPKKGKTQLNLYVDRSLVDRLKRTAEEFGGRAAPSQIASEIIDQFLDAWIAVERARQARLNEIKETIVSASVTSSYEALGTVSKEVTSQYEALSHTRSEGRPLEEPPVSKRAKGTVSKSDTKPGSKSPASQPYLSEGMKSLEKRKRRDPKVAKDIADAIADAEKRQSKK